MAASDSAPFRHFARLLLIVLGAALCPLTGPAIRAGTQIPPIGPMTPATAVISEARKLTASDGKIYDLFGSAVAIHEDKLVVGVPGVVPGRDEPGAAYVFERDPLDPSHWTQTARLTASDGYLFNRFGASVSIGEDMIIVGAPGSISDGAGAAYIFTPKDGGGNSWSETAKLSIGGLSGFFGTSVDLTGGTVLVGAPVKEETGAAYVFEMAGDDPTQWVQTAQLTASDASPYAEFGAAGSIDGDTIVLGAPHTGPVPSGGSAYVFQRYQGRAGSWIEITKLLPAGPAQFGYGTAVDIRGDTAIVGSPNSHDSAEFAGAAFLFGRHEGGTENWGEITRLTAADAASDEMMGTSVAIAEHFAAAGAPVRFGSLEGRSGVAYIFGLIAGDTWLEIAGVQASDPDEGNRFGSSVGLTESTIVVGAPLADDGAGAVYVYQIIEGSPIYFPIVQN